MDIYFEIVGNKLSGYTISNTVPVPMDVLGVPIPPAFGLFASGLLGLIVIARRRSAV
jgi:hypothetical protein